MAQFWILLFFIAARASELQSRPRNLRSIVGRLSQLRRTHRCKFLAELSPRDEEELQQVTKQDILDKLFVTSAEMERIQNLPQKVPGDLSTPNPEWIKARQFRLTASTFGAAAGHNRYSTPKQLVERLLRREHISSPAMDWGNEHERDAEAAYTMRRMSQFEAARRARLSLRPHSHHNGPFVDTAASDAADERLIIEHPGLCIHPEKPWLAASPDGYIKEILSPETPHIRGIGEDGEEEALQTSQLGIVEYKCPSVLYEIGLTTHTHTHTHTHTCILTRKCKYIRFFYDSYESFIGICLFFRYSQRERRAASVAPFYRRMRQPSGIIAPIPPYYFDQIQGTMAVTGREWCDFVVWTPSQTQITRYYFDADYWNMSLLPALEKFYFNLLLPSLVTKENHGVEEAVRQHCQ